MPVNTWSKKKEKNKTDPKIAAIEKGRAILLKHPIFGRVLRYHHIEILKKDRLGKETSAISDSDGNIYLNKDSDLTPAEWAYTIAHCMLHNAFGHFDGEKMPGYEKKTDDGKSHHVVSCDPDLWNLACDIYVSGFLNDIKLGNPTCDPGVLESFGGANSDELKIYEQLREKFPGDVKFTCGTAAVHTRDMKGLEKPVFYDKDYPHDINYYEIEFAEAIAYSVSWAVLKAGGNDTSKIYTSRAKQAAEWFLNHFPLLGGLASCFEVTYSKEECNKYNIEVAAVDVSEAVIYVNPDAGLNGKELRFVLAHEFLHAGLCHHERRQGREPFLWNVACDFVIHGWLMEMDIGQMPYKGCLYDEQFKGCSAEEIYDRIVSDLKKYSKLAGFRGAGIGDIIGGNVSFGKEDGAASLDDFYRSALQNGLEYHKNNGRGLIPAGLEEEIRALAMPPIPWNAKLADWFDVNFRPLEKRRSYVRPSRRQGATPDIPRPRCVRADIPEYSRTFGVVVDTSGSMSAKLIGYALGAIASYSAAREVPYARVVFCDASAYDAGYMAPDDIAGKVMVMGRGGTVLQPGVDMLQTAKDFPKDVPILIITDGYIEDDLKVKREHAFLVPQGRRLPFRSKGEVFYFGE